MEIIPIETKVHTDLVDITDQIHRVIKKKGVNDGMVFIYSPHTTAGITINEGADPAVKMDIINMLEKIVPRGFDYRHLEGNSHAHIKASLVGSGATVIVEDGDLYLGRWQRIFFCEFDGPRSRQIWVKIGRLS
ncbi:MAG: secondary thiamine-phosphate synthase enzyme YjbQ [Dissulfurimicrobium sp.]|uniref:secondary thiamine-phosphate synthase enzyme YjbQ n=1 Tax=Dissulfurimicrobium TaxID=1769732 RepID=UPI001ED9DF3E|nr:secondary thiamine-phosphate synthase enzyme YjbQ [Dissulfurimicrobium hydrothermale]UKL13391.1 secondary thiamine-phosphate synthase enzyme YjbQ [Dissulfurimicrobium hydrothermale]